MSKPDYYGAKHDAEVEAIEELRRAEHEGGLCRGAPECGYCQDEIDERKEQEQAEGYYIGDKWVK